VSEACDLRWDDLDLAKRTTIIIRRSKGSEMEEIAFGVLRVAER
jgi:integrase